MNKLFIGLLIAAIGAGTFFYLQSKKQSSSPVDMHQKLVGAWTLDHYQPGNDSTAAFMTGIMGIVDTNATKYQYQFTSEGSILRSLDGKTNVDSSRYTWNKENELVWQEPADSSSFVFAVLALNKDSLLIRDKDSAQFLFRKMK